MRVEANHTLFSCGIETKVSERFNEIRLMWRKSSEYFLLWPYVYCTIVLLFVCGALIVEKHNQIYTVLVQVRTSTRCTYIHTVLGRGL